MKLDLVNDLFNNLKENKFVQNFIKELSNYLEKNSSYANEENPIIEDILSKNNFTTGNQNAIRLNLNDVILTYSQKNPEIYFVKDKKDDTYIILKANDGDINKNGRK